MRVVKTAVLVGTLWIIRANSFAQIGINNPDPDPSSVLDMSHGDNESKGVLFPTTDSISKISAPAHGLLLFNTEDQEFYFKNDSTTSWESLNRLKSGYRENSYLMDSLAIGKKMPATALDVVGDIKTDANVSAVAVNAGAINATSGKIMEGGKALIPAGVIVMWTGSLPPAGWVLCDGLNGTPDLRGRFIIGKTDANPGNPEYFNTEKNKGEYTTVGNNGGTATVSLTVANLPTHNHTFSGTTTGTGEHSHTYQVHGGGLANGTHFENADGGTPYQVEQGAAENKIWKGAHNHTYAGTTSGTGSGVAHNNIPPYYVLAFIMKQ